jgi:hypothetical protein
MSLPLASVKRTLADKPRLERSSAILHTTAFELGAAKPSPRAAERAAPAIVPVRKSLRFGGMAFPSLA